MDFKNFVLLYIIGMSLSGAAWGSLNSLFDNEGKRLHVTAVGAVQKALKNEGWTADEINQFLSIPVNITTDRANDIRRAAIEAHVRRLAGTDTPVAIAAMAPAAVAAAAVGGNPHLEPMAGLQQLQAHASAAASAAAVGGDAQPERPVAPSRQSQASASAALAATGGPGQAQQQPVARTLMAAAAMARAGAVAAAVGGNSNLEPMAGLQQLQAHASAASAAAGDPEQRRQQPQQRQAVQAPVAAAAMAAVGGGDEDVLEQPSLKKGKFKRHDGKWLIRMGVRVAHGGKEKRLLIEVPCDILPIETDKFLWFLQINIPQLKDLNHNQLNLLYVAKKLSLGMASVTEAFLESTNKENYPLKIFVKDPQ